jgi:adenosylcobinamide-GDP ribazoletransferase
MATIFAAFQFLTIFPAVIRRPFSSQEMGRAVGWFPLVGLALGGIFYMLDIALRLVFPLPVVAVLIIAASLLLTRALHFDGFLDICDGLFGGFTPERRLEIMRDSRVGAFGVAGGGLLLLTKYAALISLADRSGLLLAPLMGRWVMAMGIYLFPYARQKGLGRDMKNNVHWTQILLATAITILSVWLLAAWTGLLVLTLAALTLWLGATFILRRVPAGLTGDAYGALNEIVEMLVLLLFTTGLTL